MLQLTVAETTGIFSSFYRWLDDYLALQSCFYRPYDLEGAVAKEPWHISYCPLARHCQSLLSMEVVRDLLRNQDLLLSDTVDNHFQEIYQAYVAPYFLKE